MRITKHTELEVYKRAFAAGMTIFESSKAFPKEETYSLTDQIRRSSRSVCANLAEAWRCQNADSATTADRIRSGSGTCTSFSETAFSPSSVTTNGQLTSVASFFAEHVLN